MARITWWVIVSFSFGRSRPAIVSEISTGRTMAATDTARARACVLPANMLATKTVAVAVANTMAVALSSVGRAASHECAV
ncbi:hypothetical protein [Cryptosporangium sp. NPDC048952]|uniref:hypothetical protein n=1 Tax=Cryptosporangium sp. NPDC048952 TaxID=3363961 RepID=UPI0037177CBF